jgi:phosphoribosylanthranilate isomerase
VPHFGRAPENLLLAVKMSVPHAAGLGSDVKGPPGQKDLDKNNAFMDAVSRCKIDQDPDNRF